MSMKTYVLKTYVFQQMQTSSEVRNEVKFETQYSLWKEKKKQGRKTGRGKEKDNKTLNEIVEVKDVKSWKRVGISMEKDREQKACLMLRGCLQ